MSNIGQPVIDIEFIQKAVSAIARSERGIACVVVYDDTVTTAGYDIYKYLTDVDADNYTEANYKAISKCFLVAVNKVVVVHVPTTGEFSAVTTILETIKYNYICVVNDDVQQDLVNYLVTKNQQSKGKKYIGVTANATTVDSKYIINLKGDWVHEVGATANTDMVDYLPRLVSILANLPLNRSITYYELEDIDGIDTSYITTTNDIDYWINKGYLVLWMDEDVVKVGRGVNSLTTFTSTDTEDMRKIIIVESMNLILEDIYNTFKNYYIGKYKNNYDNQCLFITAVNSYLRTLASEEILEKVYDNHAYVDVPKQREAWLSIGKTEAEDWDENKVKEMTFKSTVFLAGNIKILDAIEDLKFTIEMA